MKRQRLMTVFCIAAMMLSLLSPIPSFAATTAGPQSDNSFLIADFKDEATCTAWGQGPKTDGTGLAGACYPDQGYEMNWLGSSGGNYFANEASVFSGLNWSDYKYLQFSFNLVVEDSFSYSGISNWVTIVLSTAENAGEYTEYKNNECLTYEIDLSSYPLKTSVEAIIPLDSFVTQFDGMQNGVQGEKDGTTPLSSIRSISILGAGMGKAEVGGIGHDAGDWTFKSARWANQYGCGFVAERLSLYLGDAIDIQQALDTYMKAHTDITENIELPTSISGIDGSIVWDSDRPDVISPEGVVTASAKSEKVVLTATITGGDGSSKVVQYQITVVGYAPDGVLEYRYNADMSQFSDGPVDAELESQLNEMEITSGWQGEAYNVFFEDGALVQQAKTNIPNGTQPSGASQLISSYNMVRDGTRQYYEVCYSTGLKKEINFAFQAVGGTYNSFIMVGTHNSGMLNFTASAGKGEDPQAVSINNVGITANAKIRMRFLFDTKNDEVDGFWISINDGEFVAYNPYGKVGEPFGYNKYQSVDANNRFNQVLLYASGAGSAREGDNVFKLYYIRSWTDMSSYLDMAEEDLNASFNSAIGDSGVVRSNLSLPTSMPAYAGVTVNWESSNPSVIANDGTVHLPANNTEVTLTANLGFEEEIYEDITLSIPYTVIVGGLSDEDYIVTNDTFYGASALNPWLIDDSGGNVTVEDGKLTFDKSGEGFLTAERPLTENSDFELKGEINIETGLSAKKGVTNTSVLDKSGNSGGSLGFSQDDGQKFVYTYKDGNYIYDGTGEMKTKIQIDTQSNTAQIWHNEVSAGEAVDCLNSISGISKLTTSVESGKLYISGMRVTIPNSQRLSLIYDQLTWDLISADPMDAVTSVDLFTSSAAGIKISWTSSNEEVISNNGTYTRPEADTPVTLTARLYKEEDPSQFLEKQFDIVVLALDPSNLAYGKTVTTDMTVNAGELANVTDGSVNTVFSGTARRKAGTLTIDLGEEKALSSVKIFEGNQAIKAFTVEISSDNTIWSAVHTGTVIGEEQNIPFDPALARYVRLSVTDVQTAMPITISEIEVRFDATDQQCVDADAEELSTGESYEISSDLDLEEIGKFGSAIEWVSSHPSLISNSGKYLGKPTYDTVVVMKATLTKGNATAVKTFNHLIRGSQSGSISGGGSGGSGGSSGLSGGGNASYTPPSQETVTPPAVQEGVTQTAAFNDLDGVPWAEEAITALKNMGIVSGNGTGEYEPAREVTREEFVKMLLLTLGVDISQTEEGTPFTDCAEDQWYYSYVVAAYKNGIVEGMSDGTFGIGTSITRQDMAVMISRAAEQFGTDLSSGESKTFVDAENISEYAVEAVDKLSAAGLLNGDDAGRFNPMDCANRAEVAVVMYRLTK
ncbi:immunoglobulin-like domain-containing protein [Ructibacterium gallinarum]|uniref:S-layer homology domain-containing protein n=1 Tax=Ructibacterium gallinarum TaxID=2779355 RepID=A0A9D5M7G3_9FIRM|nr:immunoglobulin-like domain-containing protein [Ructibacterium gallinarum]MBE5040952.1 S-layer homology domain-containing protein [Ructibacterium gallinarum]